MTKLIFLTGSKYQSYIFPLQVDLLILGNMRKQIFRSIIQT